MIQQVIKARNSLSDFRKNREQLKRFTFGRQSDETDPKTGRPVLTNNLINQLVKTLVGHFRETMGQANPADHNRLNELDARTLEEFLISGAAIQRISRERRPGFDRAMTWVDNVSPADFFAYPLRDPRGIDVEIVGMTHHWSVAEAIGRFADGDRQKARQIRQTLLAMPECIADSPGFERCSIIEIWNRQIVELYRCHDRNEAKIFLVTEAQLPEIAQKNREYKRKNQPKIQIKMELQTRWVGHFLSSSGMELHRIVADNHPFALKFYPLLDGEIHSFVAGLIDQQIFVNRLINLIDNIMSTSAKGVLLFPQDEIAYGMDWDDIAERWGRFDGIIPYLPRPGSPGPHQVVSNPSNCGAYELLNIQMKFFDRISGVSNALRGNAEGGNSAQLYDAQTRNSLAAISDIFNSFRDFLLARNNIIEKKETT